MPDIFQILADPTRRRLVQELRGGERSVGELVRVMDIGQPGVSRQLGILEEAQFVLVRPDGRRRFYALRPEPFVELEQWMLGYKAMWEARLDRFEAALERRGGKRKRQERNHDTSDGNGSSGR